MSGDAEFGTIRAEITANVRRARADDLPALEWMGLYTRHRDVIERAFAAQQRGDGLMLLAISAGFPIAQVWIDFTGGSAPETAVLWAVRTFFPLQRTGIGRRMMEIAEAELRRRGYQGIELEVEAWNEKALGFYQRLGWRVERHPNGDKGWLLGKRL